jgi:ferredoxin-NADP reductase
MKRDGRKLDYALAKLENRDYLDQVVKDFASPRPRLDLALDRLADQGDDHRRRRYLCGAKPVNKAFQFAMIAFWFGGID